MQVGRAQGHNVGEGLAPYCYVSCTRGTFIPTYIYVYVVGTLGMPPGRRLGAELVLYTVLGLPVYKPVC